jgi:hypothetical protein
MAGLHDFGKAVPGFQFKWPAGQRAEEEAGLVFKSCALDVHSVGAEREGGAEAACTGFRCLRPPSRELR